jgi:hypothetical protein
MFHALTQVKAALRELRGALPELLRARRAGVAAALLAAAARRAACPEAGPEAPFYNMIARHVRRSLKAHQCVQ